MAKDMVKHYLQLGPTTERELNERTDANQVGCLAKESAQAGTYNLITELAHSKDPLHVEIVNC
jgi:hypothetical protein